MKKLFIATIAIIFIILSVVFYAVKLYAPAYSFSVLMIANALIAILSLSSFFIVKRQMAGRPQAFVRGVFGASYLKMFVCLVAMLTYIFLNSNRLHKPTVFVLLGIYAVYTIAETWMLSVFARKVK